MKTPVVRALLLGGALLFANAAMADQIYASVGGFTVQTIDLTPTDGAAAGVSIFGGITVLETYFIPGSGYPGTSSTSTRLSSSGSGQLTLHHGGLYGSISYGNSGSALGGFGIDFSDYNDSLQGAEVAGLKGQTERRLTVTANTMVIVSGRYSHSYRPAEFNAQASIDATLTSALGQQSYWYASDVEGTAGTFSLAYVNNTAQSVDVSFELQANFSAGAPQAVQAPSVSPVPEPSSWLMLGGGLALVGLAARRRAAAHRS